jgi:hypothetical protein
VTSVRGVRSLWICTVLALAACQAPKPPAQAEPVQRASSVAEALDRSLRWLRSQQSSDGSWPSEAGSTGSIAPTALAVLALTRDAEPARQDPNHEPVVRGVKWLLGCIDREGQFTGASGPAGDLEHGIATLALVEAYAKSRSWLLKPYVQRAVNYAARSRKSGSDARDDASATGWRVLALVKAKEAGLAVDERAFAAERPSEPWSDWSKALPTSLLAAQRLDGAFAGSFDGLDTGNPTGGLVGATALLACCFEDLLQRPGN